MPKLTLNMSMAIKTNEEYWTLRSAIFIGRTSKGVWDRKIQLAWGFVFLRYV